MAKAPSSGAAADAADDGGVAKFIEELRKHPSGDHVIRGMVKPADADDGVMFTHEGDCENWIHIPLSAMQVIRAAGHVGCGSHSHVMAEIQLKDPEDELSRTFANIASLHRASLTRLQATLAVGSCSTNRDCPDNWHCGPDGNGGKKCLPGPF